MSIAAGSESKGIDEYAVLRRLFRYSRADWQMVTFGTLLLLCTAICKCFRILFGSLRIERLISS